MLTITAKPYYDITVQARVIGRKTPIKQTIGIFDETPMTAACKAIELFKKKHSHYRLNGSPFVSNIRTSSALPAVIVLKITPQ